MSTLSPQETALVDSLNSRESAMIANTRRLASSNSGSLNRQGIKLTNQKLASLFSAISEHHTTLPLSTIPLVSDSGQINEFETEAMHIFSARSEAPLQILCTGHSDTVFAQDSSFQATWIEDNRLRGPGVADMKGGFMVLLEALRAIGNSPFGESVGFTVAISPDEEIGSPASAPVLSELAKKADFGLTYEPALADGTLAGARKGSGNFTVVAKGKSVHAGRDFFSGRNAITALARLAILLEELSDESEGISVNIGKIVGGDAVNVVPGLAVCRFNVRIRKKEQMTFIEKAIRAQLKDVTEKTQCELTLHGSFNRPPKTIDERQQSFFDLAKQCGRDLGMSINFKATGGCCEGNNLAEAGLVNIDTLGVRGGAIHSDQEFACIDSFVERAQFSALLIARLCASKSLIQE